MPGILPALLFALHFHACVVCVCARGAYFENEPAEPTPARWKARYPPLKRGFHLPYSADGVPWTGDFAP